VRAKNPVCGFRLVFVLELAPGVLLRQHAAQVGDVGLRLLRRKLCAGDLLGLLEAALQADDERQVLAHAAVGGGLLGSRAHIGLGGPEIAFEHVGHAKVGEDRRIIRPEVQRTSVERSRLARLAELVENRGLGRHQLPVGVFGRLGALHRVERRLELAGAGERLAIGREHVAILRIGDGELAHDGERLLRAPVHL
jgi:hypothetical protein